MKPCRHLQHGVALVAAVFLLTVLATLGAYMVSLSGTQESATSKSLQAARVYFAAKAGIEWAIHRTVYNPTSMCSIGTATTTTFTPAGSGFNGVSVAVNCSYQAHSDPGVFNLYYLSSTATYGILGDVDYAQRRLDAVTSNKF